MPVRRPPSSFPIAVLAALALASCGQEQQGGGAHGFPPAQVTIATVAARDLPVSWEYVGQTTGSKDVEVRARAVAVVRAPDQDRPHVAVDGEPVDRTLEGSDELGAHRVHLRAIEGEGGDAGPGALHQRGRRDMSL